MNRRVFIQVLKVLAYMGVYGGLLMPVMFIPVVIFPFVFSKLLFFQILIGVTFPAYVVLAVLEPAYRPPRSWLLWALCAYFGAVGLSVAFSIDPLRSWWGNQERMNGLFTLLHLFAWLVMAIGMLKSWIQWRNLLNYQIVLSAFMAVVSILEKPFPNLLGYPTGDRLGGLLDNPIYMGAYQIFNFFFLALLWVRTPSRSWRIWYGIVAVLDVVAFVFAESRGALVGLGIGILVAAVSYAVTTSHAKARRYVLAGLGLLVAAYAALFLMRDVPFIQSSPLHRFTDFNSTTRTRMIAWEIAWQGFKERPLTGWGFDTFHILFNQKYNPESLRYSMYETWFDRSHNTVMDMLSMTGVLGTTTFFAVFGVLFWLVIRAYLLKRLDAAAASILLGLPVAYFIQNLFVFDHPAAFSMSFLLYALVISMTSPTYAEDGAPVESNASGQVSTPLWAFVILQATALILIWYTSVQPMRASMLSIDSNRAFMSGAYERAYNLAVQASEIPTPYLDEQTYLQSRNLLGLAAQGKIKDVPHWREWHDLVTRMTERYLKDHPNNLHPHYIYARFANAMAPTVPGDVAIAEREYKRSIELSPKRQQLYYNYTRFLIDLGRTKEAIDLLRKTVAFDDQIGESRWNLGLALAMVGGEKEAGMKELAASQNVLYPYALVDVREAVVLAQALDQQNDKDGLRKILPMLTTLSRASDLNVYLQIAASMEHQGLKQERDMIVKAVANADPIMKVQLQPVLQGTASSIVPYIGMSGLNGGSVVTTPTETSTPIATTSAGGPRR